MLTSKSRLLSTAKSVFRAFGLEVSFLHNSLTEQNVLRQLFAGHEFKFLLDVGANAGQYGLLVRKSGYHGPIISFEPLQSAHEKLTARAAADPNWTVAERGALGARSMRTTINVSGNSVSSSLFEMHARHIEAAAHSAVIGSEEINVTALDDCIDRYVNATGNGLLKIDTQGYEIEVLRGANRSLSDKIDVVQIELSLVELYEGQPLMLDVCNFLKQHGFGLSHVIPGFKDPRSGRLLQLDGFFCRE